MGVGGWGLDGGIPVFHVDDRIQEMPMSMSYIASKRLSCRLSNLRITPHRVLYILSHVTKLYLAYRF